MSSSFTIFVGTYGEKLGHVDGQGKGVYAFTIDRETLSPAEGRAKFHGAAQLGGPGGVVNPSFLLTHRDESGRLLLYACDERYGAASSTLHAALVDEATSELTPLGAPVRVGESACHLIVAPGGRHVLVASYTSGDVYAVERRADGSLGDATVVTLPPPRIAVGAPVGPLSFPRGCEARQDAPHAHMVLVSPSARADGVTVLVPDLGSDVVWALRYDGASATPLVAEAACATDHGGASLLGGGPRHMALHPSLNVAYVGYELTSQVAAYAVDADTGRTFHIFVEAEEDRAR